MPAILRQPITWVIAAFLAVTFAGTYWYVDRQQKIEQAERERVAEEQAEQKRKADAEARRQRELKYTQEAIVAIREAEEKQRQQEIELRATEQKTKQFVEGERPARPDGSQYLDERLRRAADQQQQSEEEANRNRAQQDVERQRRFLQEREEEERAIRERRDRNARDSTPLESSQYSPPDSSGSAPKIYRRPASSSTPNKPQ
jgi:N-methylhydantoinase A/oxoprolinase/acetone carboxylase beta subunit